MTQTHDTAQVTPKLDLRCSSCGSPDVTFDAIVVWDTELQGYVFSYCEGQSYCKNPDCGCNVCHVVSVEAETGVPVQSDEVNEALSKPQIYITVYDSDAGTDVERHYSELAQAEYIRDKLAVDWAEVSNGAPFPDDWRDAWEKISDFASYWIKTEIVPIDVDQLTESAQGDAVETETAPVTRVAYETMQFFEIDLPEGEDPEEYCNTKEAREHFADLVTSGFIDFQVERLFDAGGQET